MTRPDPTAPTGLAQALRALRADPPPGFPNRVLARLGIPAQVDQMVRVEGPTGALYVAFTDEGVCHVLTTALVDDDPARFAQRHRARFGRPVRLTTEVPAGLLTALRTGHGRTLRYDLHGLSDFEQAVLRKALDIPRGETRPYAWIAREIGRPAAVRAVGSALGRNPVPILIPCHRVVRSDGHIGDYVFGADVKRRLLTHEHVDLPRLEQLANAGVRYLGSNTTTIYCFPTCHNARRISPDHQVPFATWRAAAAAGYQPCRDCRPAEPRTR